MVEEKIKIRSAEGDSLEIDVTVAKESELFKRMVEDGCISTEVPLQKFTTETLLKVIEYCKKHVESEMSKDKAVKKELKAWDADYIKVDQSTLIDLILAAHFLEIPKLLDFTCQTVADMIKGKTSEEIRTLFNLKRDFTPEEEEQLRTEVMWQFE